MIVMAPIRPTRQPASSRDSASGRGRSGARERRAALPADPRAVAEARHQVTAALRYWRLPVDADVAALCVSELVTNAITHGGHAHGGRGGPAGGERARGDADAIALTIRCADGRLRVDVHDLSPEPPVLNGDASASAEGGRGLFLIDSLAASWGSYRTPAGKAVFFTL